MTGKELREKTEYYANEWAGKTINPSRASRESALHGPPIEFAIAALERALTPHLDDCDRWSAIAKRCEACKHNYKDVLSEALATLKEARQV